MSISAHRQQMADIERRAWDIVKNQDATLQQIANLRAEQDRLVGGFGFWQAVAPTQEEIANAKKAYDIGQEIKRLQAELSEAENFVRQADLRAGKAEVDQIRARFFGTQDGMEKAYEDAKKDLERLQKELFEPEKPLTKTEAVDLDKQLRAAEATEARRKAALDATSKSNEARKEFERQAAEFEKQGEESELDALGRIYYARDQLLKQAREIKASESEIAAIRKAADEKVVPIIQKAQEGFEKYADQQQSAREDRCWRFSDLRRNS